LTTIKVAAMVRRASWNGWLALSIVLFCHVAATCYILPPVAILRDASLPGHDYPIHTHRVYVYREALRASGLPWGYDPHVAAGLVLDPVQDPSKPQQVLGALLPFLTPATVVALFAFVTVLLAPLPTLLACRQLRLALSAQAWALIAVLSSLWLMNGLLHDFMAYGMTAYLAAVFVSPWVLTSFLRFIEQPSSGRYIRFAALGCLLFLMHGVGPLALVVPLTLYALCTRRLAVRWRVATALTPGIMIAVNAFWCVPWWLALQMPRPPWAPMPIQLVLKDFQFQSWAELGRYFTPMRAAIYAMGIATAFAGLPALARMAGRGAAVAFGLAGFSCLLLGLFGSFLPVVVHTQPLRLLIPATIFLGLAVGVFIEAVLNKLAIPSGLAAVVVAMELAALTAALGWLRPMPLTSAAEVLAPFVAENTSPGDRLLVQSLDHQPKAMPIALGREVIGNTYPEIYDPIQFTAHSVFGKLIATWQPAELRETLRRYGVRWVFTRTEAAGSLFANTLGESGEPVGSYRVFPVRPAMGRFLIGDGRVKATLNRLELSALQPEGGVIVLRYRYHPAWRTSTGQAVQRYPVAEEPAGFLALDDPPAELTLEFDPWAMLWTPWPVAPY
jgi:hypothetical protein